MKKLVIWDGDETLWKGTLLEGGGELTPETKALCEELARRGVLQALCSYNRPEDAESMLFRSGLDQIFLHSRATLDRSVPKSQLIKEIIAAYGLSKPSDVLFIDDDPLNLAEVVTNVPGVDAILPSDLANVFAQQLSKEHYTDEDRLRVARYRSDEARKVAGSSYPGGQLEFLRSCNIRMVLRPATKADWPRILDLYSRANQTAAVGPEINTAEDLHGLDLRVVTVEDRFGSYGLSGFVGTYQESIYALVVSCRTQGRGVGSALLGATVNRLLKEYGRVYAVWNRTAYNGGVAALYQWYKFKITETPGITTAQLVDGEQEVALPDWIAVEVRG